MELLNLLSEVLGTYIRHGNEYLFHCPFCHHGKKKLSINTFNGKWQCWTCGKRGGNIIWLVKNLNISTSLINKFKQIVQESSTVWYEEPEESVTVTLPQEYKPLWKVEKTYEYLHAIRYLKNRGMESEDILRYRIGFCTDGPYKNRIILPSYDKNNELNFFTGRSFYESSLKYKNPPVSKNVVCFENMIDWNEDVILCEGMFDAISIRRNAIPLMGKVLLSNIELALVKNNVSNVIIFLDVDARTDAMQLEHRLREFDINTKVVLTEQKDASDMGFNPSWVAIENAHASNFKELIKQRMQHI